MGKNKTRWKVNILVCVSQEAEKDLRPVRNKAGMTRVSELTGIQNRLFDKLAKH